MNAMDIQGILIREMPVLKKPVLIAGFGGWGNALNVATDALDYLIRHFEAEAFARLDPDAFFRHDQLRPTVKIVDGVLEDMAWPDITVYNVHTGVEEPDLVLLKADEPSLNWYRFTDELLALCRALSIQMVITLGSMYDNVLHSDRIISGMASREAMRARLKQEGLHLISYEGPSAIHAVIQTEAARVGLECLSLWSHCPYYLQGTTHFGLLASLCHIIGNVAEFTVDTAALEERWMALNRHIQTLIETKPELREMINKLRKEKLRGTLSGRKATGKKEEKVIDIKDFFDS
jgi:proteasome assembly chaperone (PAC2) family protein